MNQRHLTVAGALLLCTAAGCRGHATAIEAETAVAHVLAYDVSGLDEAARNQVASLWRGRLLDAGGQAGDVTMEMQAERIVVRIAHPTAQGAVDPEDWRAVLERTDHFQLRMEATPGDLATGAEPYDLTVEYASANEWLAQFPNEDVRTYNATLHQRDPELARLDFYRETGATERLAALILEEQPAWRFTAADLARVYPSTDVLGLPAVGFELRPERAAAFADFTRAHIDERLAIVLNGEILTFPVIQDELPGKGIINGGHSGMTNDEALRLVGKLRSAMLLSDHVHFIEGRVEGS